MATLLQYDGSGDVAEVLDHTFASWGAVSGVSFHLHKKAQKYKMKLVTCHVAKGTKKANSNCELALFIFSNCKY